MQEKKLIALNSAVDGGVYYERSFIMCSCELNQPDLGLGSGDGCED